MAEWIKNKKSSTGHRLYPECSNCGYYWIETCLGEVGKGYSNIKDAHFCPNCGEKMTAIIDCEVGKNESNA